MTKEFVSKPWNGVTEEERKEFQDRCVAFWDKLEKLCREEAIIPFPHYDQDSYSFQMEGFTEGSWRQLRDKVYLVVYMYGITVEKKTE